MNSRPYLVITLALTTLVGAGVAWNQYRELVELRAAALNPDERAEWQKRAWDLEARNRELQDQLAALQSRPFESTAPRPDAVAGEPPPEPPQRGGPRGGRGQQFAAVRDLVNKPEVQALMRVQQTAAVDARYAALFHSLNLDPAQNEKLKALLVERQSTLQDVMAAAREQGINPRNDPEAFRKLIADAQNDINDSIRGVVGDNGLVQLQNYEQTLPQRTLVNEIQQRLSYTNTPLTPSQADQLVQILATTAPQRNNNQIPGGDLPPGLPPGGGRAGFGGMAEVGGLIAGAMGGGPGGFGGGNTARVTAAAVAQAQTVLAPPQVAVLQQVQEQQQSQQKLQQILRETVSGGQNGGGTQPGGQGGGGQGRRKGGG